LEASSVAREIALQFDGKLQASDWTRANPNLFRAIEIEKRMIFIIMVLIITVAAFNVVSTLVMLVTDKQADIAILRTLGAAPRSVMQIFIVQGAVIGVIGTLLGLAGGLALALNVDVVVPALETALGFKFLSKDVYQIPDLPSKVEGMAVAIVCAVSLVLSLPASLHLLGALHVPRAGTVRVKGRPFGDMGEAERARVRNETLGFVYQFHHLLPEFTALENVAMPLFIPRMERRAAVERARAGLTEDGVAGRIELH